MMGQPGNFAVNNPAAIQSAMMMKQGMATSMGQGPTAGGGVAAAGMMGPNGLPNNEAIFLGMQQQFQQQAGAGGATSQLPGDLRNPMMGGNVAGGAPANGGAGFNSQAQAALYWSALQASGMGNHQQSMQQGQAAGPPNVQITVGAGSSQLRQQVGAMAEFQHSANHGLTSNQAQTPQPRIPLSVKNLKRRCYSNSNL